eukprot:11750373-Alexandrium_andersonii.AAC.1
MARNKKTNRRHITITPNRDRMDRHTCIQLVRHRCGNIKTNINHHTYGNTGRHEDRREATQEIVGGGWCGVRCW